MSFGDKDEQSFEKRKMIKIKIKKLKHWLNLRIKGIENKICSYNYNKYEVLFWYHIINIQINYLVIFRCS